MPLAPRDLKPGAPCRLDVLAIGSAVVDVIASADDDFLASVGIEKNSMGLLDDASTLRLYERMGPAREISGGSAANTVASIAALGGRAAFVGQVADDQLGAVFRHDIIAHGVEFTTPPLAVGAPTGRCLITVTPDAQRTMRTSIGASYLLDPIALDRDQIEAAAILYIEGYMWGPAGPRAAIEGAMAIARAAGRSIAFTLSDPFCIASHFADFRALIDHRRLDILFANEAEIKALAATDDLDEAIVATAAHVPLVVVTRGEHGAVCVAGGWLYSIPAAPLERMVDTTGAGDLFAAGFLFGHAAGRPIPECLTMGALCAAEIISHYGARPETSLKRLVETAGPAASAGCTQRPL